MSQKKSPKGNVLLQSLVEPYSTPLRGRNMIIMRTRGGVSREIVDGGERGVERTSGYVDCHGTVTVAVAREVGTIRRFEVLALCRRERRRYLATRHYK